MEVKRGIGYKNEDIFNNGWLIISKNKSCKATSCVTSEAISHEDLVSQRVAQNHTDELPVPRPLDVLAALTGAVGWVILEGEGNPDRFPT